ncbi:hypothetical protein ABLN64_11375 [Mycobacterium tuberculosis]
MKRFPFSCATLQLLTTNGRCNQILYWRGGDLHQVTECFPRVCITSFGSFGCLTVLPVE